MELDKVCETVWRRTLETCRYISGYTGKRDAVITLHCEKHNLDFQTR